MMGPLPLWAEVAFAAVEDRTEGTIVVDGVMLGIGLPGQVTEPITWTMEKGRATAIEGGDDAASLQRGHRGVENADVAGEFAFGVSESRHRHARQRRAGSARCTSPSATTTSPTPEDRTSRGSTSTDDPGRQPSDRRRRPLHRQGRRVGAVTISVVALDSVDPIELPSGSWSRMLVTQTASAHHELARLFGLHAGQRHQQRLPRGGRSRLRRQRVRAPRHHDGEVRFRAATRSTSRRDLARSRQRLGRRRGHGLRLPSPDYPPTERR